MLHHNPPPPPPPPPAERPTVTDSGPLTVVSATFGVAAAIVGFIVPAIAFALPGTFGAMGLILVFAAQKHEGQASTLGIVGGIVGLITAFLSYEQYSEAMDVFNSF